MLCAVIIICTHFRGLAFAFAFAFATVGLTPRTPVLQQHHADGAGSATLPLAAADAAAARPGGVAWHCPRPESSRVNIAALQQHHADGAGSRRR